MAKISRRQFAGQIAGNILADNGQDDAFVKYANKELPSAYKTTNSLASYAGPWTTQQVRHLLARTTFGARPGDISFVAGMSMSDAVDYLLNNAPATSPLPPINSYTEDGKADITGVPSGQTWVNAPLWR